MQALAKAAWRLLRSTGRRRTSGQVMVEYLVMTGILLGSLAVLALFLTTFRDYGFRVVDMVGSDYP